MYLLIVMCVPLYTVHFEIPIPNGPRVMN